MIVTEISTKDKYKNNPFFHRFVDCLVDLLRNNHLTLQEIQSAAELANYFHEQRRRNGRY